MEGEKEVNRLTKIIGILGLMFLISMLLNSNVSLAAMKDQLPTPPTEGTPAIDPNQGVGIIDTKPLSALSSLYFKDGKSFISATGRTLTISGNTSSYVSVNTITVNLYLQQWNDSQKKWINVTNIGEFSKFNTSFVTGSKRVIVPGGFYYRTRAQHLVYQSGMIEQDYSNTSYIYVK